MKYSVTEFSPGIYYVFNAEDGFLLSRDIYQSSKIPRNISKTKESILEALENGQFEYIPDLPVAELPIVLDLLKEYTVLAGIKDWIRSQIPPDTSPSKEELDLIAEHKELSKFLESLENKDANKLHKILNMREVYDRMKRGDGPGLVYLAVPLERIVAVLGPEYGNMDASTLESELEVTLKEAKLPVKDLRIIVGLEGPKPDVVFEGKSAVIDKISKFFNVSSRNKFSMDDLVFGDEFGF